MKEGGRQAERERQSNLQMHLLDAPNEICLSWRGACSRKKKSGSSYVFSFLSLRFPRSVSTPPFDCFRDLANSSICVLNGLALIS